MANVRWVPAMQAVFVTAFLVMLIRMHSQHDNTGLSLPLKEPSGHPSAIVAATPRAIQSLSPKRTSTPAPPSSTASIARVYVITPTFTRLSQKADLTRLSHSLRVAAPRVPLHWVVVEDEQQRTPLVANLLKRTGLPYTHLNKKGDPKANLKGGEARNEGIRFLRNHTPPLHPDSVVYFADDDNVYDDRLFDEIITVRTIGIWPVGFSGQRRAEFAYLDSHGRVTGFNSYLAKLRRFPLDMAGFALNIKYFQRRTPLLFDVQAPPVFGETLLLEATGESWDALEPKADNCTKVLVWHVKGHQPTIKPGFDLGAHIAEV